MPRRHLSHLGLRASIPPSPIEEGDAETMGYPRPQLRRPEWFNLNGEWDFAIDADGQWTVPEQVQWNATILVPFSPETERSGIGDTSLYRAVWYRRRFEAPELAHKQRLILHFGAVDYEATVWVDGTLVARHEGGYTPFWVDITDALEDAAALAASGGEPGNRTSTQGEGIATQGQGIATQGHVSGAREHEIIVLAADDPLDLAKPRGKQDWQLHPHSIWYPRTTGIWQTVWLERVPDVRLDRLQWTPSLEHWEIALDTRIFGHVTEKLFVAVKLKVDDLILADDKYTVVANEVHRRIALSDPGIDDFRNELLWSPERPKLIEAEVELLDARGNTIDRATSYTALRTFAVQGDRFLLNGRPYPLRLVLDQGYWQGSGMTAPSDAHLRRDVELARAMGFNGVRKHQKIECPRYLYWADRLGLLVWEEMPSAYRFTRDSVERLAREWLEVLRRDSSHPCIMAWVPFNESWGVPNLPNSLPERNYVRSLYYLTKTMDPTRPVIGNDGWESVATDIIGIHDYDENPERLGRRYWAHNRLPKLFKRERPGGRSLMLEGHSRREHPIVLSEFGGIAFSDDPGSWGYSRSENAAAFAAKFTALLRMTRSLEVLAGYCYTQFADTYQEANGLLRSDRSPKIPIEQIALATRGSGRGDSLLPPATLGDEDPTRGQRV